MPTATVAQRWELIREVQAKLVAGDDLPRIVHFLMTERGKSRAQAYRYHKRAYADWRRGQSRSSKDHRISKAIAERDHAKRLALAQKKFIPTKDTVEVEDDPDVKTYLAACDSEAKLLGLFAPEKKEFILTSFTRATEIAVQCIIEEIADVPLRQRLLERMQRAYEEAAEHADAGKEPLPAEVKTIEATIVQRQDPPSTNGNGAH
jgi:hypothetical protein